MKLLPVLSAEGLDHREGRQMGARCSSQKKNFRTDSVKVLNKALPEQTKRSKKVIGKKNRALFHEKKLP
ncbi:MAG: hypothetical protein IJ164_08155 [Duodenibacillus sp.]|nr:hypothetical protein [Duodenibacillus sp.]